MPILNNTLKTLSGAVEANRTAITEVDRKVNTLKEQLGGFFDNLSVTVTLSSPNSTGPQHMIQGTMGQAEGVLDAPSATYTRPPDLHINAHSTLPPPTFPSARTQVETYSMNREATTILDLWREWTVGVLPGKPSIEQLNEKYGSKWRVGKEANFYSTRKVLIDEIKRRAGPGGDCEAVVALLEEERRARKSSIKSMIMDLKKEKKNRELAEVRVADTRGGDVRS
jgi:hypothetical protein